VNDLDCQHFVEQVTSFLEGGLNPDEEALFLAHLPLCDGCDRYLDQIRQTIHALDDLPTAPLSPDARTSLLDSFRTRRP
jgi:anti-sigma factor RsiW